MVGCGCRGCSDRVGAVMDDREKWEDVHGISGWHPMRLDDPLISVEARRIIRAVMGSVAFGLLCWAAIYELVKW